MVLLEDGCPLTLLPDGIRLEPPVPVECTLVDGKGVGDVGSAVLRERRILGDEGHLSNDAAAEFARLAVQSGTRDILLAHLSKENNTPELAEYAVARALQSAGLSVRLGVAPRDTMSEVHLCRRSPSFASAN